ncbi:sigma-70 family RNA polymerase sigma factor [Nocardioides lianchengensis]|uniref:RNA polymerase sigma-B factor n=1 Tax=Nocardioides lianchengensis TaxID=1045774 RepID=A0A1G6JDF2_9ACTN|nr:sigma-70 family RNA polymerase sigma factor [Nocardioides lianchengensis]NYG12776.1 RNA polymerase sigma-B factor [Nocardioides lianchengensis]SDC16758.1 RNA polymerase sigma-B factor [Nocardioides lianchengensis]
MGSDRYAREAVGLSDARRRAETARLLSRAHASSGEDRARYENDVVRLNLGVAADVARRYHGRGIAADDIDQVACLGMVKAVRAFDPTRGDDFLSFAVPTLRGEIRRYFRDAGWTVRPPRPVQETQERIAGAEAVLSQRLGRTPRPSEIAVHLDVPLVLVLDSLHATGCFAPVSLDAPHPYDDEGRGPADLLGELDPAFASAEARLALQPLIRDLSERERTIIEMRYFDNRTQAEIGAEVGVSQEQVSRLIAGILSRLRERLAVA